MSDRSTIEWTDASWNPIRGTIGRHTCVKVSPGCEHCYAERMTKRFGGPPYKVGADTARLDEKALQEPMRWKQPRKIFVCSMTDLFGDWVPDEWIDRIVEVMWATPQHTYQVLTKRAQRMHDYWYRWQGSAINGETRRLPDNLWLGVTAESQQYANERIPLLMDTPAAVRFVSCEPLLGPIDLNPVVGVREVQFGTQLDRVDHDNVYADWLWHLHWVITGGESGGPDDRRLVTHLGNQESGEIWTPRRDRLPWVRAIRDQCQAAGVPFFHKQWGGPTPKSGGALLDGQLYREFPAVPS